MASAGGKDWMEGERTTMTMAAEKKPEIRMIQSILQPPWSPVFRRRRRRVLKWNRSAKREMAERRRRARVPLRPASSGRGGK